MKIRMINIIIKQQQQNKLKAPPRWASAQLAIGLARPAQPAPHSPPPYPHSGETLTRNPPTRPHYSLLPRSDLDRGTPLASAHRPRRHLAVSHQAPPHHRRHRRIPKVASPAPLALDHPSPPLPRATPSRAGHHRPAPLIAGGPDAAPSTPPTPFRFPEPTAMPCSSSVSTPSGPSPFSLARPCSPSPSLSVRETPRSLSLPARCSLQPVHVPVRGLTAAGHPAATIRRASSRRTYSSSRIANRRRNQVRGHRQQARPHRH